MLVVLHIAQARRAEQHNCSQAAHNKGFRQDEDNDDREREEAVAWVRVIAMDCESVKRSYDVDGVQSVHSTCDSF